MKKRILGVEGKKKKKLEKKKSHNYLKFFFRKGFPGSTVAKETACHAGDLGLIPG